MVPAIQKLHQVRVIGLNIDYYCSIWRANGGAGFFSEYRTAR